MLQACCGTHVCAPKAAFGKLFHVLWSHRMHSNMTLVACFIQLTLPLHLHCLIYARYFQCEPKHGLFAPLPKVEKLATAGSEGSTSK